MFVNKKKLNTPLADLIAFYLTEPGGIADVTKEDVVGDIQDLLSAIETDSAALVAAVTAAAVELRDSRISFVGVDIGVCIAEANGAESSAIRLTLPQVFTIACGGDYETV